MSTCEPLCAILLSRVGQGVPGKQSAPKCGELRGTKEKQEKALAAFRAPGRILLPAVRAVAGTGADAFLTEEKSD